MIIYFRPVYPENQLILQLDQQRSSCTMKTQLSWFLYLTNVTYTFLPKYRYNTVTPTTEEKKIGLTATSFNATYVTHKASFRHRVKSKQTELSTKKPVTTMLTYPWKCTVLHCNHLGNTWKPLVLMTRHFDYCPSASEGDNQSVRSSAPVVSRCFPGGYNVKLYISRGRLARWLLAFLHSESSANTSGSWGMTAVHIP